MDLFVPPPHDDCHSGERAAPPGNGDEHESPAHLDAQGSKEFSIRVGDRCDVDPVVDPNDARSAQGQPSSGNEEQRLAARPYPILQAALSPPPRQART